MVVVGPGSLAELFAIDPVDLGGALSVSGEINAYAMTELGWSATEAVLDQLTDPDGCAPQPTGYSVPKPSPAARPLCSLAIRTRAVADTTQSGVTLGVAATTRVDADTLLGGVVSISQSRAAIDGLGDAEVASVRFGASLTQHWQSAYLALGAWPARAWRNEPRACPRHDGHGIGRSGAGLSRVPRRTGGDLPLNGETALTPFAACPGPAPARPGCAETVSGGLGDAALVYGDAFRTRSSMDLGVRLASGAADAHHRRQPCLSPRAGRGQHCGHRVRGSRGLWFRCDPAAQPTDQLLLSADAAMALGTGATLGVKLDAGLAEGYSALAREVSLNGQWWASRAPRAEIAGRWRFGHVVHGTTSTRVPMRTRAIRSRISALSMRIQPYETNPPMEPGALVPWMA